ncbi:MAG: hypothetical protein KIC89_17735 [Acetobacteraceae bacterium]|nr:hypothetical protein [Acetobacteraceae bacterium]
MHTEASFIQRLERYRSSNTVPHAVWVADWQAETDRWSDPVLLPRSNVEPALAAAEFVQSLDREMDRQAADRFFSAWGGRVAWFFCRREGDVAVAYLRQAVGHHSPILTGWTDRVENKIQDVAHAHPLLARFLGMREYSWDTPEYRTLCADLGLDPDFQRPCPLPEHAEMGGQLIRWLGKQLNILGVIRPAMDDPRWVYLNLGRDMVTALLPEGRERPWTIREILGRLKAVPPHAVPCRDEFLRAFADVSAAEPGERPWRPVPPPSFFARVEALLRRPVQGR